MIPASKTTPTPNPSESNSLFSILRSLDRLLNHALSQTQIDPTTAPYRGLYLNREDLDRDLQRAPSDSPLQIADLQQQFLADLDRSPLFDRLRPLFNLTLTDLALVIIALAWLSAIANYPGRVILAGNQANLNIGLPFISIAVPALTTPQRRLYWQTKLIETEISVSLDDLNFLSDRFRFTPEQIDLTIATAQQHNAQVSDLLLAARQHSGHEISTLAQKVLPKATWDDFVLPPDLTEQLHEICQQVKHRPTVYHHWGFDRKLSRGKGISALFSGSPGTGKTMAAEVIANELQLDLYKIDLSQIVSKYIGETEKNLDRVFTAAQTANAILFFDEADALFGKRSETKDAHDRHANIEVSYLLQKMEDYEGITILATNFRQNLDDAFIRRIQINIEFSFPDETARQRLWQVTFPPKLHWLQM